MKQGSKSKNERVRCYKLLYSLKVNALNNAETDVIVTPRKALTILQCLRAPEYSTSIPQLSSFYSLNFKLRTLLVMIKYSKPPLPLLKCNIYAGGRLHDVIKLSEYIHPCVNSRHVSISLSHVFSQTNVIFLTSRKFHKSLVLLEKVIRKTLLRGSKELVRKWIVDHNPQKLKLRLVGRRY